MELTQEAKDKIKLLWQLGFSINKIVKKTGKKRELVVQEIDALVNAGEDSYADFAYKKLIVLMGDEDKNIALKAIQLYLSYREISKVQEENNKIKTEDLAIRRGEKNESKTVEKLKELLTNDKKVSK